MSDFSYQATQIVNSAEYWFSHMSERFDDVISELKRPSVVYKPEIAQDGNAFLAILGDLPTGVVGCGDTPDEAMRDFDKAWFTKAKVPTVREKKEE